MSLIMKKKRERKGLKTFSSSPYKQTDRLSLSLNKRVRKVIPVACIHVECHLYPIDKTMEFFIGKKVNNFPFFSFKRYDSIKL